MSELPIERISYSSCCDYSYCGRYFNLVHIQKVGRKQQSPDTIFGSWIHSYVQSVLEGKLEPLPASIEYKKKWKRLCSLYKLPEKYLSWDVVGEKVILNVREFFKEKFGNFKVRHIEYQILQKLSEFPQNFKGFIDIVLELEDGKIVVADFKTAGSLYFFKKYQDAVKDYQIVLYKKFYSEIEKIDIKNIDLCFIVLEKNAKSKTPISLIEVTSGNVKLKNAENWVSTNLMAINSNKFFPNRSACHKFGPDNPCVFFRTKHCK